MCTPVPVTSTSDERGMVAIAAFKIAKGILSLVLGLGLLELVHAEIATLFSLLIEALRLNADSRFIHGLVLKVDTLQPHAVMILSLVSLGYGGLLLLEGIGLWLGYAWAAYLTVVSTSLFIPLEVYEILEQKTIVRIGILVVNAVIVLYLLHHLRRHMLRSRTH